MTPAVLSLIQIMMKNNSELACEIARRLPGKADAQFTECNIQVNQQKRRRRLADNGAGGISLVTKETVNAEEAAAAVKRGSGQGETLPAGAAVNVGSALASAVKAE